MRVCYRDCLPRCRTPWLLVVDADEFVFADRPLTALLDTVPESVDAISFPTAEAVWGPGDDPDQPFGSTYFRTKWPSELQWRLLRRPIYGAVSSVMRWACLATSPASTCSGPTASTLRSGGIRACAARNPSPGRR